MAIDEIGPGTEASRERLGWRTFRPPPPVALIFGAVYGAIAGAIIVWDAVVLIRAGRIIGRRVSDEINERRHRHDDEG
jgi:hypothetical protein